VNNKPWHVLNIDISNAIRPDFNFKELLVGTRVDTVGHWMWSYTGSELTDIFTIEWLSYMKSINLEVYTMLMFYKAPFLTGEGANAHVDLPVNFAINWCVNKDDSEMVWYDNQSDVDYDTETKLAPVGGYLYLPRPLDNLVELERRCLGNIPTLVQTDIFHSIVVNESPRWSISVRVNVNGQLAGKLSWQEAVDLFSSHIVI
jgi:hypothetical protein